jgi:hypothetical protein
MRFTSQWYAVWMFTVHRNQSWDDIDVGLVSILTSHFTYPSKSLNNSFIISGCIMRRGPVTFFFGDLSCQCYAGLL